MEETFLHYRILEKLGAGGMGVVYKAEDTKLGRVAAVKTLPPDILAQPTERARLLREARAAAALNHPNVCTVHEIHDDHEPPFMVMEYVEGTSLRELLADGPLEPQRALDILRQVACALQAAHAQGIVHRDLKPENIMITPEDRVKVLDFGLARMPGLSRLTREGETPGTTPYMAPELFRGEDADARTDIWSLGVVAHEMLSGKPPFSGDYAAAVMYAVLNEDPSPLPPGESPASKCLQNFVGEALKKKAPDRLPDMAAAAALMDTNGPPGPETSIREDKSIIVLPFANLSADPDQEYFSDGLTEEIITDLANLQDLTVISRGSAMTFKHTSMRIGKIAAEIGVRYVLEGSVRRSGDRLRITAQLIDAATDTHLWANKYNGSIQDVFGIQEQVARSIARAMQIKLDEKESRRLAATPVPDIFAFECYLKARHELWKWTADGLGKALDYLNKGLEAAGENAVLLAGMGYVYYQYCNTGVRNDAGTLSKAEDFTQRALRLDPDSAYAHVVLALLKGWRGDPRAAVSHLHRALETEPNHFDALVWLPCFLAFMGKSNSATPYVEHLQRVEPYHPMTHFAAAKVRIMDGRFREARDGLSKALEKFPDDHLLNWIFAQALLYSGDLEKAHDVIDRLYAKAPDDLLALVSRAASLAIIKRRKESRELLKDPRIPPWAGEDFGGSYFVAEAYACMGDHAMAVKWLKNSINKGFSNYPFLKEYNPLLHSLRDREGFHTLLKQAKKTWEEPYPIQIV